MLKLANLFGFASLSMASRATVLQVSRDFAPGTPRDLEISAVSIGTISKSKIKEYAVSLSGPGIVACWCDIHQEISAQRAWFVLSNCFLQSSVATTARLAIEAKRIQRQVRGRLLLIGASRRFVKVH